MDWLLFFCLAVLFLLAPGVLLIAKNRKKAARRLPVFPILFSGIFLSLLAGLLPIYDRMVPTEGAHFLNTLWASIQNAFQVFTIDADMGLLMTGIQCPQSWLTDAYTALLAFEYVLGPVFTFGFVISFFRNALAYGLFFTRRRAETYLFSQICPEAVFLAESLRAGHPRALLIFAQENGEDTGMEWTARLDRIRAVLFRKDMLSLLPILKRRKAPLCLFVIGWEEDRNLILALRAAEILEKRKNARMYIFADGIQSELLLSKASRGLLQVYRVDPVRSLIQRNLYEDGHRLFETARANGDGDKDIHVLLLGLGRYGTEMLRALVWYCQMDGYRLRIDVFDRDPLAAERFSALCPELMDPEFNGRDIPGEARYHIVIHPDTDVTTRSFCDAVRQLPPVTWALVALDEDSDNIHAAASLRTLLEQLRVHPPIQVAVSDTELRKALTGLTNFRGQPYDIEPIGSPDLCYSEKVILHSDLEQEALHAHLKWGQEKDFWQYEYNYRSSIASVIHRRARTECRIPGAAKAEKNLTPAEKKMIESLEHRRWNAYMRSEGYIYSGSPDKASRNDMGKMHNDLVSYLVLSEEEKRKNSRVGSV